MDDFEMFCHVPVIVITASQPVANVLTVNVADVCPAGTVTEDGRLVTHGLLVDRATIAPPLGAVAVSVTVPRED